MKIESMVIDPVVNFGKVTVSTGYTSAALSIILNPGEGAKLPDPSVSGWYNLVWWNSTDYADPSDDPNVEIIRVTSNIANTLGILRGQEGTSASNKNIPTKTYKLILSPTKKTITDIQTDISASVKKSGDTMTGILNLPLNGLIVGTNQLIVSGGNIGIGTITPLVKLHIVGTDAAESGTAIPNGTIMAGSAGSTAIIDIGTVSSPRHGWIQSRNNDGAIFNNLVLNPSGGNVGIGTTSPEQKLHVVGGGVNNGGAIRLQESGRNASQIEGWGIGTGSGFSISTHNGTSLVNRVSIDNNGNVGIGTTSPSNLFTIRNPSTHTQIDFDSSAANRVSNINLLNNGVLKWNFSSRGTVDTPNNRLSLYNSVGSEVFTVLQTGNIGIGVGNPTYALQLVVDSAAKPDTNTWTISSDERIKKDIRPFTDGISTILNINPIWYKYNGKGGFKEDNVDHIGVIGQEIKDIAPYTIDTYKAKLNEEDTEDTELLNFNSHAMTFVLINAMKEINKRLSILEAKLGY